MELGDTQAAAAAALGVSERTARERLRLLTLPAAVRNRVDGGHVRTTAGRQLQLIADASPTAASALAKQITKGTLRAGALLDPQLTCQALAVVRRGAALVSLDHNTQLAQLPLKPPVLKELKKRARKAAEFGGDWIDLSPNAPSMSRLCRLASSSQLPRAHSPWGAGRIHEYSEASRRFPEAACVALCPRTHAARTCRSLRRRHRG